MRIAAIDIGTNSVHMIVVRVREDLSFEIIDREKVMVRLGAGGLDGRSLTAEAMHAGLQALSTFKRLAEARGVDAILAVATSATREASNGGEFLARIEHATGIVPRVITGSEEARLIHLAATYGVDVGSTRAVVIDIGGGSVEITCGTASTVRVARSFKVGVIRLMERFVTSDPLSSRDERNLTKHIRSQIDRHCAQIASIGFDQVIGTSGTILSLGAMACVDDRGALPGELRNLRVPVKQIRRLRKEVVSSSFDERLALPGQDPKRADLVVAGAVLLDTILKRLGAETLTLCDLALREGVVIDYIRHNQRQIAQVDRIPDVRRRSTVELAERCSYLPEHSNQVAKLALALFDQTQALHGLGIREREWLEYGALLHDIGTHISFPRHHRHSQYLIMNGDLRGFQPEEIEVIALIARYHRRSTPKKTHEEYARLSPPLRRAVQFLASMLRIAEGLDRSHSGIVTGVEIQIKRKAITMALVAEGDAELEVWAATRHVEPLARLLGREIRLSITPGAPARPSGRAPRATRRTARAAAPSTPRPARAPQGHRRRTVTRSR
jgi:exopolyphosphatase/guanosine-5'-triphosphate,3'-diphosphate pyrophosphatase